MYVTMPPKFERDMTPDRREGLRKSLCEVADMDFRTIHCPFCKTYLFDVFADSRMNFRVTILTSLICAGSFRFLVMSNPSESSFPK